MWKNTKKTNNFIILPGVQPGHHCLDAGGRVIQGLDEEVPDVRHQIGEAEEAVSLSMFSPFQIGVGGQNVVNWSNNFIHPLNISLT